MCGIFCLPRQDNDIRDCQFNVLAEQHPPGMIPLKKSLKIFFPDPGLNPATSVGERLLLSHSDKGCKWNGCGWVHHFGTSKTRAIE